MNKLRILGLFVILIGVIIFLSTAFEWKDYVRGIVIAVASLPFVLAFREIEKEKRKGSPSLFTNLLQLLAFTFVLILASIVITQLGQRYGLSPNQIIYLFAGATCLVGLSLTAWSFRKTG